MRKLRLDLDELAVETFAVDADEAREEGTVEAHELAPTLKTLCGTTCGTLLASNPTCCPCTPMF
ncbi:MAG TPA: hypothetical protein VFQ45_12835 [Longimicrobium sp.]|nr:hypothetical protein [Longimicrobium sp.]